jgi:hypothetical protein
MRPAFFILRAHSSAFGSQGYQNRRQSFVLHADSQVLAGIGDLPHASKESLCSNSLINEISFSTEAGFDVRMVGAQICSNQIITALLTFNVRRLPRATIGSEVAGAKGGTFGRRSHGFESRTDQRLTSIVIRMKQHTVVAPFEQRTNYVQAAV